ncbi:MAG: FecR domain-containing protein [Candidatus Methylacidiphilales bacterium]
MKKEPSSSLSSRVVQAVLVMGLILLAAPSLQAQVSLTLDEQGRLLVQPTSGEAVSLDSGTISQKISADNQIFKISFGDDLSGRKTIIIYPDPESPQALNLNILGQPVQMSQDSVLTITATADGASSQFQAGVMGSVSLAGSTISPGSSLSVQNGQMLSAPPPELLDEAKLAAATTPSNVPQVAATNDVGDFSQGMIVKEVNGLVMMAPPGSDVMGLLRNADQMPALKAGDIIPTGASLRTDFGGSMVVAQSPGVTIQVLENTDMQIQKNDYRIENGVEKREFQARMTRGGVINNLDGVDPNHTDYRIQTPLAVAAARGTSFSVYTSSAISVFITASGRVEITTPNGTFSVSQGQKSVVTFDPVSGESRAAQFTADSSEMAAVNNLIQAAQKLNAANQAGESGNPSGVPSTEQKNELQKELDKAVEQFLNTFQPTLNPGAITPTTPGQ